jgi:hypothetical protein
MNANRPLKNGSDPIDQAGIREYQVLCSFALGVVFLLDIQHGSALSSLLLLLVGLLGVMARLRIGPILFLLSFTVLHLARQRVGMRLGEMTFSARGTGLLASELATSLAVLAYVLAQYRLQSLVLHILPPDPRRRSGRRRWLILPPKIVLEPRAGGLVTPAEIAWFVLALPAWGLLAQGLWLVLSPPRQFLDFPPWLVRLIYFGWALGVGTLVTASLFDYWQRRRGRPEIAALYLQDVLWRETRREQRRCNRWIAWWRIRRDQ